MRKFVKTEIIKTENKVQEKITDDIEKNNEEKIITKEEREKKLNELYMNCIKISEEKLNEKPITEGLFISISRF